QVFHAGDKRRDANPAADPDLACAVVVEREAAVRPLDLQRLPDGEPVAQSAGVVAQLADAEGDDWVRGVPTRGDGVGVRTFRCIHGDKAVLPGLVAGPATQLDLHFQRAHVVEPVQGLDGSRRLPAGTDAAGQYYERGPDAAYQQRSHQPADG